MPQLPPPRVLTSIIFLVGCIAALSSLLLFAPTFFSSTRPHYESVPNTDSLPAGNRFDQKPASQNNNPAADENKRSWDQSCAGSFLRAWIPPALQPVLTADKIDYAAAKPMGDLASLRLTPELMAHPSRVPSILCPETLCSTQLLSVLGFPVPPRPSNLTILFIAVPPAMPGNSMQKMLQEISEKQNLNFEITINAHKKWMRPYLRTTERENWDVVYGIFAYGLHRLLPSFSYYTYMVMVQPPVERWIEHYHWARDKKLDYVSQHPNITSWARAQYNCNMQFAMLSGLAPNDFSLLDRADPSWPVPCRGYDQNHMDIVQRVKDTLSGHFKYVIPQDRAAEAVPMLCHEFQLSKDSCRLMKEKHRWTSYSRVAQVKETLSSEDSAAIKEQTHLDRLLYEHANQLFEYQLHAFKSLKSV